MNSPLTSTVILIHSSTYPHHFRKDDVSLMNQFMKLSLHVKNQFVQNYQSLKQNYKA